jgi:membrane fusion protein (multidrug efflux system)
VYVVGADDKIVEKRVSLGDQHGADWIVLGGIDAGARVVVSGIQKAKAGEKVKPVAYASNAKGKDEAGTGDE